MSNLQGTNLEVVDSIEKAQLFLTWLSERRPVLAIDTETTGLDWWKTPFTRLVQFGDGMTGWTLSALRWRGLIEIALKQYEGPIAMHNASFDMHALTTDGFPIPKWHRVHDTKIMHHLLHPSENHHLKKLGDVLIDPTASLGQKMLDKGMQRYGWTWATVPEEFEPYTLYAAGDTIITARLYEMFKHDVDTMFWLPYQVEMIVQEAMFDAETRGIRIDWKYATQKRELYREEMERLKIELEMFNVHNPSSGKQIEAALRDEGWEPDEFTPSGNAKTSEEVLKGVDSEIVPKVIRYKRLRKWMVAYLHHFIDERDSNDCVHPSINSLQAKTGRMSITRPPLQTLPKGKEIRDCIIAKEGKELWAIDYDNVELRLAASLSEDPFLISAFNAGVDMHSETAKDAFGADFTPKHRQRAKNGRYSLLYGAGVEKMAKTLGIEVHEAIAIREAIEKKSPNLVRYARALENEAGLRHQMTGIASIDTWGGRIATSESDKLYKLLNYKIQGTAVDLFKHAIVEMWKKDLDEYIVVPIHDENLLCVPTGQEGADIVHEIHRCMEFPNEFIVPLTCSISGPGNSWGSWYPE
jgi:DNA polymerase-1